MKQKVSKEYIPVFTQRPRYIILMGGRSAGRSYTASQFASAKLVAYEYFRCAVMRFILTDVRNSIFQDIVDRFNENEIEDPGLVIRDLEISYGINSIKGMGFRKSSGQQKSKLKSLANFNCVIIEEADEVDEDDFMQLDDSLRTTKGDITIILLLNPPDKNHWINKRFFNLLKSSVEGYYMPELKESVKHNTIFIHTTYKNNLANISESTVSNFERYKETKPDHYYNMIEGLVSDGKRGVIFNNWKPISAKEYEELPYPEFFGLDFGFTNDPASLTGIKQHNENVYVRQVIYQTGLLNKELSKEMEAKGVSKNAEIFADSAEPKSIAELKSLGWNILPADKGADSVRSGIDYMLGLNFHYTEDSDKIIIEKENYTWRLDRNKEPTNEPIDDFNHAMDSTRYAVNTKHNQKQPNIRAL